MWIMIAGPYTSGPASREENLATLNRAAYEVFMKGHIPIIGVNMAKPIIEAVLETTAEEKFDELMMPVSLALSERCDAILRIGGPSSGADLEVERFRQNGRTVYKSVADIPANRTV